MFTLHSSRACGSHWGVDETRVWDLWPALCTRPRPLAVASLSPCLSNGMEIVAFAPSVCTYSLGLPAYTKQQSNLRVSGYGAGDWDRGMSRKRLVSSRKPY